MTLTLHLSIIKFRPEGTQTGFNRNELEPDPFSSLLQGYEISTFRRLDPRRHRPEERKILPLSVPTGKGINRFVVGFGQFLSLLLLSFLDIECQSSSRSAVPVRPITDPTNPEAQREAAETPNNQDGK